MTFEQACELIRDLTTTYHVLLRYRPEQKWSFKFEFGVRQFDALDILFMHHSGQAKPRPWHGMQGRMGLSCADEIALYNLQSGNWRNFPIKGYYDEHRRTFERITGIKVE